MIKRSICILLMLIFISQCAFAQDIVFEESATEEYTPLNGVLLKEGEIIEVENTERYSVSFFNTMPFDEYIAENSEGLPKKITGLGQFNITEDEFADKYFDAVLKHPETLIKTEYTIIDVDDKTNFVTAVTPVYLVDSVAAADEARADMEAAIKEYTDLADKYETDIEKLLVIHDKMVADCTYDVRVLDKETVNLVDKTIYHALGVLRDKFAVCQGYSQALYMIGKELGIEMDFCYSEKKNHMWNYVKLDGKWYHMDMTNDDPAEKDENDKPVARTDTRAYHDYFLVSNSGLTEEIHGDDWRCMSGATYECNDTRYGGDHLFNIPIPFTAQRGDDGDFHVLAKIESEELGIDETEVDFKSESLYTGAMLSRIIAVERFSENGNAKKVRGLYVIGYPTRDIENAMPIVRLDGANQIAIGDIKDISRNAEWYLYFNAEIPEGISVSFTTFLWDAVTLTPYSAKSTWSQQQ